MSRAEDPEPNGIAAKGTYIYKEYSADLTLIIPPDGGGVSGRVEGVMISVSNTTKSFEHIEAYQKAELPLLFFDRVCV
jgi:hypothetical protein